MKVYKSEALIEEGKHLHLFCVRDEQRTMPLHTHDFIEIVYIVSGNTKQTVDGISYDMKRGDILFLNYGSTHMFSASEPFSYINVCFSPELLGDTIITPQNAFSLLALTSFNEIRGESSGGKISFSGKERDQIEQILFSMLGEYEGKEAGWHTVTEHYLGILLTWMLRHTELTLPESDDRRIWKELSEYIDANLDTQLNLSTLAGKCFYNPSYFSRIFKEKFGSSPIEYITRRRLETATALLRETDLTVDEISTRAGFSDRRNFYHAFSRYMGCSPSEYRAKK
ncbi:MAG: helix-turn-helix domain-containing protein [Clostridia bacterium]|nr:helix-turn-helix domain-containing protein [Clostridia bacterium]